MIPPATESARPGAAEHGSGRPQTGSEAQELILDGMAVLFANAETTERTVQVGAGLARALGYEAEVFPGWEGLTLRLRDERGVRVAVGGVAPTGLDMRKALTAERAMQAVSDGWLSVSGTRAALRGIGALPPIGLIRFVAAAAAAACALAILFGASHWSTFPLIALSAGGGAWLRRELGRVSPNLLVQPFVAALLAGTVGGIAIRLQLSSAQALIAVCPCMVLVPGPHLLNGLIDLTRARAGLGCARLAFSFSVVFAISAGLVLGLWLLGTTLPLSPPGRPIPWLVDVIAAGVAVAAYSSFFSMPFRFLPVTVVVGMAAHVARWLALSHGASLHGAALLASLLVGGIMTPVARRSRLPFPAVAFAAVVSLIPGVFLFRIGAALVQLTRHGADHLGLASVITADGAAAGLILAALGCGLVLPALCADLFHRVPVDGGGLARVRHL